jgi:hypothetical protein
MSRSNTHEQCQQTKQPCTTMHNTQHNQPHNQPHNHRHNVQSFARCPASRIEQRRRHTPRHPPTTPRTTATPAPPTPAPSRGRPPKKTTKNGTSPPACAFFVLATPPPHHHHHTRQTAPEDRSPRPWPCPVAWPSCSQPTPCNFAQSPTPVRERRKVGVSLFKPWQVPSSTVECRRVPVCLGMLYFLPLGHGWRRRVGRKRRPRKSILRGGLCGSSTRPGLARGVCKRGFATAGTCRNKRERERRMNMIGSSRTWSLWSC